MSSVANSDAVSILIDSGVATACRAARAYLDKNGLSVTDTLVGAVQRHARAALQGALDDARDAFACNMADVGLQTFHASMALAGIAAARESAGVA